MDDDPVNPIPYMQAAALAHVVVDAYIANDRQWLPEFFSRLEQLITDPANPDKELLVVGVVEDLQGAIGWARLEPSSFYAMLGPNSKREWDGLTAQWERIRKWRESGDLPAQEIPDVKDPNLRKIIRDIYRPPR